MSRGNNPGGGRERSAPWYPVPSQDIVSVEHPCIVKNVEKAIDTLQGHSGISEMLNSLHRDSPLTLLLNPEDVMSRPLRSTSKQSNNILLKVSVPRRTGRRRKRGSQDPFVDSHDEDAVMSPDKLDARGLLRRLQENAGQYQVDVVGQVNRTHVFRELPDFAYSTTGSPFVQKFRETVLPFEYDKLKEFELDMTKGAVSNVDIVPPPALSNNDVAFQYLYRQNPTVRRSIDSSGQVTTTNTQRAMKVLTHLISYDTSSVPTQPLDNCPPLADQDPTVIDTVAALRLLFAERPAWTRRGLRNKLPTPEKKYALRLAIPYVGYLFRSGPWRDGIFRFGYDPRATPDSRIYQTLMFRMFPVSAEAEGRDQAEGAPNAPFTPTTTPLSGRRLTIPRLSYENNTDPSLINSHLFTGQPPLARDGKTWMITDITDPILQRLLDPSSPEAHPPRLTCDVYSCGWYGNVTLSIARAIMRKKLSLMVENRTDWPTEEELQPLLTLPSHVEGDEDINKISANDTLGAVPIHLVSEIRTVVRNVPWKMDKLRDRPRGSTGGDQKRVRWDDQQQEEDEAEEGEEHDQEQEDEGDEDEEMEDFDEQAGEAEKRD
ncbi:transcription factor tau subunit sfc1 [Arthroderma uncinatum]|uniref:transcription factor tau subunit sfc1 n=1 Tax=Arthroderma uncinatum TaxID=74035 RepID=UPI00144AB2CA|nr:transcription factor tau subunit sfc1 [Arthroderma uncinatum]KAF3479742.1 transcription factor tau subunit sfc1 [Arthroderma uncinatum]